MKRGEAVAHLAVMAVVAITLVGFTLYVVANGMFVADDTTAETMRRLWVPSLQRLWQGIALLGGVEVTTLVALALFAYLWRMGHRLGALAVAADPMAVLTETIYKHFLHHPGPPTALQHADGPSLTDIVQQALPGLENSFPSGHVTRTIVVYGLLAFVLTRLARHAWLRAAASPAAILLVALMVVDRIFLVVHWESDVIGGILLGLLWLLAGIFWLEYGPPATAS